MNPNFTLIGLVIGAMTLAQALTLSAASKIAKKAKAPDLLADFEVQFSKDIERRSRHGQGPDWPRYLEEAERKYELYIDRLRTFASTALAVGLGGTILSLLANLAFEVFFRTGRTDNTQLAVQNLTQGTIFSLFGSLVGVVAHLIIVIGLMKGAEDSFSSAFHLWQQRLQAVCDQHEPRENFVEVLLQKWEPFRRAFQEDLLSALSSALPGFPQAMAELGLNLDRLAGVVEKQGGLIESAVGDLQGTASAMEKLAPAAEVLAGASAALAALPEKLESTLAESRRKWLEDLRREEGAHLDALLIFHRELEQNSADRERQMAGLVLSLQNSVAEVREEISRSPAVLVETIAKLSHQLGIEFGQHARDSINELAADLKSQQEILLLRLERREQELRNNIGLIVKELFDQLSDTVEHQIVDKLASVGEELHQTANMLPAAAQRIADASESWHSRQEESLRGWTDAADRIQEAARSLGEADHGLSAATESLAASADHLERVATLTDNFEQTLRKALVDAAAQPLSDLVEIRKELQIIVSRARGYQEQIETTLKRQSVFIRRVLRLVVGRVPSNGRSHYRGAPSQGTEGAVP